MRFYVMCGYHSNEKVYVRFQTEPHSRQEVPAFFQVTCPNGYIGTYSNWQVMAEPGFPIGMLVGAVLFLIDPLLGLIGAAAGGALSNADEQRRADQFNRNEVMQ